MTLGGNDKLRNHLVANPIIPRVLVSSVSIVLLDWGWNIDITGESHELRHSNNKLFDDILEFEEILSFWWRMKTITILQLFRSVTSTISISLKYVIEVVILTSFYPYVLPSLGFRSQAICKNLLLNFS